MATPKKRRKNPNLRRFKADCGQRSSVEIKRTCILKILMVTPPYDSFPEDIRYAIAVRVEPQVTEKGWFDDGHVQGVLRWLCSFSSIADAFLRRGQPLLWEWFSCMKKKGKPVKAELRQGTAGKEPCCPHCWQGLTEESFAKYHVPADGEEWTHTKPFKG